MHCYVFACRTGNIRDVVKFMMTNKSIGDIIRDNEASCDVMGLANKYTMNVKNAVTALNRSIKYEHHLFMMQYNFRMNEYCNRFLTWTMEEFPGAVWSALMIEFEFERAREIYNHLCPPPPSPRMHRIEVVSVRCKFFKNEHNMRLWVQAGGAADPDCMLVEEKWKVCKEVAYSVLRLLKYDKVA